MQRALICGVTGQDGAYLAAHLLAQGYEVWGTSREALGRPGGNLQALGIEARVRQVQMQPDDAGSVHAAIETSDPHEIYYLAGQSSVGVSFAQPAETVQGIVNGVLNVLEAMRLGRSRARFFHAGSAEIFGDTGGVPAHEGTPLQPRNPYGVAKASAHWLVANYRAAYGLYACNGILFNHESPLRPQRFVTQKIVQSAKRIAAGSAERLTLGRLDVWRDWGWAPEYVDAMHRMLQLEQAHDLVLATGEAHSLQEFAAEVFSQLGLDWTQHVDSSAQLHRPSDTGRSVGAPARAQALLGWQARTRMRGVVRGMLEGSTGSPPSRG